MTLEIRQKLVRELSDSAEYVQLLDDAYAITYSKYGAIIQAPFQTSRAKAVRNLAEELEWPTPKVTDLGYIETDGRIEYEASEYAITITLT